MDILTAKSKEGLLEKVCDVNNVSEDVRYRLLKSAVEEAIKVTAKLFNSDETVEQLGDNTPKAIRTFLLLLEKIVSNRAIDEQELTLLLVLLDSIDIYVINQDSKMKPKDSSYIDYKLNINGKTYSYYSELLPEVKLSFIFFTFISRMMLICKSDIEEVFQDIDKLKS